MLNSTELEKLSKQNISDLKADELYDITNLEIDESLPIEERVNYYFKQLKNPYCFRCDDVVVKIEFSNDVQTLDVAIESHFINKNSR